MSTHNIVCYEEISKIIIIIIIVSLFLEDYILSTNMNLSNILSLNYYQISSNTHLIYSAV